MAFEELASELSLDASEFVSGADDASSAAEDVSGSVDEVTDSLIDLDAKEAAAGGALAAIGTGAQEALDDTQGMRESLGRTASTMELTTDEANNLAQDLSNATFPIEDATATMDALAQQGVTTEDEMKEVANAADLVADATGTTAESVAENAGPALRAMGEDVTDLEEHMDTFTFVARNTTMDVEDFSQMVTKVGPELDEMGLSVDETAAIMSALEEKGMDSRTAMREFRQAASDAEGDQDELMDSLGLTNDELEAQQDALEDAEGSTKEHAEAANESLSTMDKLRAKYDDVKMSAAAAIGPIDAIAPVMQTAGIAAMTLSTINTSAVVPSFVAVASAAAPVVVPLAAITAAVGALYLAWDNNWLGIQDRTQAAISTVRNALGQVPTSLSEVQSAISSFGSSATSTVQNTASSVASSFSNMGSNAVSEVSSMASNITSEVSSLGSDVVSTITSLDVSGAFRDIFSGAGSAASSAFKSAFNSAIPSSVDMPSVDVPGTDRTVGGGSISLPQLNTGGVIEEDGVAMLHEGEHVYNPARADKGNPDPPGGVTIENIEVHANSRRGGKEAADALHREFRAKNLTR